MQDSTGLCYSAAIETVFDETALDLLSAITGREYDKTKFMKTGERVFNLKKMFNYHEAR